jgi:DNA-binding CsgD family transcriptional regulator
MLTTGGERTRAQLAGLAGSGLDVGTFVGTAVDLLHRSLPMSAACLATADPATELVTGTVKWGGLDNDHDEQWAFHEYEQPDLYDVRDVVHMPGQVTSLNLRTGGDPRRSPRYAEFFEPVYGFGDELRVALQVDGETWGFLALFRDGAGGFTAADQEFAGTVAKSFALGLRSGLLVGAAGSPQSALGPAVIVVDAEGEVSQVNPAAAEGIADLGGPAVGGPLPFPLRALVGAARRLGSGRLDVVPRTRLRTRSGRWVVAHASPLSSPDGTGGSVVVTLEDARPPEIIPLIVASFGLTAREQDVVRLVVRGTGTAEIARTLHLSAYTVQDHLKSIFRKAGVRSRKELTAKIFYEQYAPRMTGALPAADGWFA